MIRLETTGGIWGARISKLHEMFNRGSLLHLRIQIHHFDNTQSAHQCLASKREKKLKNENK